MYALGRDCKARTVPARLWAMLRFTVWWLLLAGCAPNDIARSSCESELLAVGDPWLCNVTGATIGQASSLAFDTESRNQVAQVKIALRVTQGTLRLGYRDLIGDHHAILTPEAPFNLSMQTRLHREHRSFTLSFEPQGGDVKGLTGTVSYSTP
jgi:hypothetical protein